MNKFTKGPWFVIDAIGPDEEVCYLNVIPDRSEEYIGDICSVHDCEHIKGISIEERNANARLIAAAPDLLEALESVEREHELLRWMKNIEERRSRGSFGIAVSGDSDAIGWQEQAERLRVLVLRREETIARARGQS